MKPLLKLLIFLLPVLIIDSGYAQEFYICTSTATFSKAAAAPGNCSSAAMMQCSTINPYSIAVYKDTMYAIDFNQLKRGIIVGNSINSCTYISTVPQIFNALTVDSTGMLYAAIGTVLYRIDPHTGISTFLGNMPYSAGGDLMFYQGQLYLAASSPVAGIVKVDIANPSLSTMFIPIPGSLILGMVSIPVDCNINKIYAMNRVGNSTQLIELNFATQAVAATLCTLPFVVYDAASSVENGLFAGVNIQNIMKRPQCRNQPASGSLQINLAFNGPAYTYQLNNSASNTTGLFTGLSAGNYTVHISSAGGCSLDTSVAIPLADTPTLQIQTMNAFCGNNSGSITGTASGALLPYQYSLNSGTLQSSATFSNLSPGNYLFQATDSNHCTSAATAAVAMVYQTIVPGITIGSVICNQNNGSIAVAATNASGYSLDNGPQQAVGTFSNLAAGNYLLSIYTAQGCRKDTNVIVPAIVPNLMQTITVMAASCGQNNGSVIINADGAAGYSINNGTQQPSGQFNNLTGGNYLLSVFTTQGCRSDTTVAILNTLHPVPALQVVAAAPDCYNRSNGSLQLSVSGTYTPYLVRFGGGSYSNQLSFASLQSGTYPIQIKDATGCLTDTTATVPAYSISRPSVAATTVQPVCLRPKSGTIGFTITGSGFPYSILYNGNMYSSTYLFNNLLAGSYSFRVADNKNCVVDSTSVLLQQIQLPECDTLYVPSAFTPDGDGRNDVFRGIAYGTLLRYHLVIYNRFGQPVFTSTDIQKGWNGVYNGTPQPVGGYVWMIEYMFENRPQRRLQGKVLLIR